MRSTAARVVLTLVLLVVLFVGAGLVYLYAGGYNVAASDPHVGLVAWVLETGQVQSVRAHADELAVTLPDDRATLQSGFAHFDAMCVTCHGAPGVERSEIGKGLNPQAPALSEAVRLYSPNEVFWIVKHGIKMTGMPAFGATHSDEDVAAIAAFVMRLPEMSEAEYAAWRPEPSGEAGDAGAPAGDHAHGAHTH